MVDLSKVLVIVIHLGYVVYYVGGEDLRLVGNLEPFEGRLEVYHGGEWGSICADGWNHYLQNAVVACRQLGFSGGSVRPVIADEVGPGRFWMDDVICQGNEDQLSNCVFNGWDLHDCAHYLYQDVYLMCEPELVLRLIGGDNQYEGRLEINTNDAVWASVCIRGWTQSNSEVACRQLGLGGGSARNAMVGHSGIGAFSEIDVTCAGNESRLEDCVFNRLSDFMCSHMSPVEDIYLTCEPVTDGVLRLEDGRGPFKGRLEVWYAGEWGTVCVDSWNDFPQNAQVACRQLGYSGGEHRRVKQMVRLDVKFWIDELQCKHNEPRISDCMFNGWGNKDCYHSLFDDVVLVCKPYRDGSIRLVGGSGEYEGRLEVHVAGEWGGVCINQWHEHVLNAHVACRQLGFTGGTFRHLNSSERGLEEFWMDNIECRGDELKLGDCSFIGWGVQRCTHFSNGVFLTCNPNKGDIQLLEGGNAYEGKVSIFLGGKWNFICGDAWNNTDAKATCRQLGFNGGVAMSVNKTTEEDVLDLNFNCNRTQKALVNCPSTTASCTFTTVAFVMCFPPVTYGAQCKKNEQCVGNAICMSSDGLMKCICENDEHTYWDSSLQFCIKKSLYGQVCTLHMSSCESNLRCQETTDIYRCACENDTFWSYSVNTCLPKMGYNETCVSRGCRSNLMCLQFDNTTRCGCYGENDEFWNEANDTCNIRLSAHAVCDPAIPGQCMSTFECRRIRGDMPYTCLCAENDSFWNVNTQTCHKRVVFNGTCSSVVPRMCDSNLVCIEYNDSYRCLCQNDTFWDIETSSCHDRLGSNATCNPAISDACITDLVCRKPDDDLMYICLCAGDHFFWDVRVQSCTKQSLYNETCAVDVPHMCHSDLLCLDTGESSRCLCNTDQFWDLSSCTTRLSYDEVCEPPLAECMDGLTCHNWDGGVIYRCVCPGDGNVVWDNIIQQCQLKETLLAIYVPDNLNITDAIAFCDVEYSGRLASEDDFKYLFIDCVEFADDLWLVSNISSEEYLATDMCVVAYQGLGVRSAGCSQTHSFVCVIQDDHITETCKDFPLTPNLPTTTITSQPQAISSPASSGLLWWVLAAAMSLIAIGIIVMAIMFRRREKGYNRWKRRKSLLGTSKVVHNVLYDPHANDIDGPASPVVNRIRKSLFNTGKKAKAEANSQSKSSKEDDGMDATNPNAVYAVVNKKRSKRKKLKSESTSVSESAVSPTQNSVYDTIKKSGADPEATSNGTNSYRTQFNELYDSFTKSASTTKPAPTGDHLHTANDNLGDGV